MLQLVPIHFPSPPPPPTLKSTTTTTIVISIEWSVLTYSIAFSTNPIDQIDPYLGGLSYGAFDATDHVRINTSIPEHAYFVFQLAFAAVTAAVISGAVVGRISYAAWCLFISLWHLFVYTPLARWVWHPTGWLAARGIEDFAGGFVVEANCGLSAFILALLVGYEGRLAAFALSARTTSVAEASTASINDLLGPSDAETEEGITVNVASGGVRSGTSPSSTGGGVGGTGGSWDGGAWAPRERRTPHNMPFVLLGAGLLFFGWLGFNSGSALKSDHIAARAFANTVLAASSGMAGAAFFETFSARRKQGVWGSPTAIGCATGVIIGLAAVTPACGYVSQMAALLIGFCAALIALFVETTVMVRLHMHVDDTLSCFSGHGVGGIVGVIATGFASSKREEAPLDGVFYGGGGALLGHQLIGLAVTVLLCIVGTTAAWGITRTILKVMNIPFLVTIERAHDLDKSMHGESAYATTSTDVSSHFAGFAEALKEEFARGVLSRSLLTAGEKAEALATSAAVASKRTSSRRNANGNSVNFQE